MKNNIKLPFDINVYSKMYQHLAFPLGIIMGSAHKDITPWLISRHINCRYCESYPRSKFNIAIDDYWNIKENLFWAFLYNTIGIPIAAGVLYPLTGILLNPMFGGFAMSLSSVCVVTNALRLRRKKIK